MNLDKAIEILENERKEHHSFSTDVIGQAQQLGIEALKRLKHYRVHMIGPNFKQLPGETKD
ncbi:hypothetical protein ES708_34895 [subsurface metagenome]